MRQPLLLPKLGLTMTEGSVAEWLFKPGQAFKADDIVFVIESEKTANEVPMEAAGTLLEISADVGETLSVGSVIGYWDDGAADPADASTMAPAQEAHPDVQSTAPPARESHWDAPSAAAPRDGARPEASTTAPTGDEARPGASMRAPPGDEARPGLRPSAPRANEALRGMPAGAPAAQHTSPRVPVTPLARRLAVEQGVDLGQVQGSGPNGRVRARDLPAANGGVPSAAVADGDLPPAIARSGDRSASIASLGSLRHPTPAERTIARKLTASKQEIPHFYLMVEAEVTRMQALRAELNASQSEVRYTFNPFILAAVGRALVDCPQANCVWTDAGIVTLRASDVGMAVSTPGGLIAPVLRDVGRRSLATIAKDATGAIDKAKAGRLSAADVQGGAITVSNAGMHQVSYMASIINPGQSMILGVGSVRELFRPDAAGQPALRREIGLVLSADHRVMDGVGALQFLQQIVRQLEQPQGLVLDDARATPHRR